MAEPCAAKKATGDPCKGYAIKGSKYCSFHLDQAERAGEGPEETKPVEEPVATFKPVETAVPEMQPSAVTDGRSIFERTKLPTVEVEGEKVVQAATFVAAQNFGLRNERRFDKYQITLRSTQEMLTQKDGLKGLKGTDYHVKFDAGQFTTEFKECADALRSCSDFRLKIWPNPIDPTGYWRAAGVFEEETTSVQTFKMGGIVVRGATSMGDRYREQPRQFPEDHENRSPRITDFPDKSVNVFKESAPAKE